MARQISVRVQRPGARGRRAHYRVAFSDEPDTWPASGDARLTIFRTLEAQGLAGCFTVRGAAERDSLVAELRTADAVITG
jgi:hypothetical protein